MKKYWHIFWFYRKLAVMRLMEYRADFYFWMIVSVMWTIFNFFFFSLLLNLQGTIGGWGPWEMYALLGVFTMLDAFTWGFMAQNMWNYTHLIFSGELTRDLIKPLDPQFAVMMSQTSYNNIPRFLMGAVALGWSLHQLGIQPSLPSVLLFIVVFVAALLFVYSLWFMVATCAFFVEKLDNINEIIPAFRRMWQVPRSVYTGLSSTIFTVVFPVGLVSSLPTEVILNRPVGWWAVYLVGISLLTCVVSRLFFRYAARRFSGVGN